MIKPYKERKVRPRGGRASGGTRYYHAKNTGENRMLALIELVLKEKPKQVLDIGYLDLFT